MIHVELVHTLVGYLARLEFIAELSKVFHILVLGPDKGARFDVFLAKPPSSNSPVDRVVGAPGQLYVEALHGNYLRNSRLERLLHIHNPWNSHQTAFFHNARHVFLCPMALQAGHP